ncbi:MAG: peptide ABC transporter substrate-binding protein [Acetobacteraceae bacterium]
MLAVFLLSSTAWAKDSLVIGVAQFPASLHPYISAQTVQYYALGFAQRPISAFNPDGERVCLLCAELPTLQNGLAKLEDLPGGGKGMAVTIKLRPGLSWGDGQPVTAKDIAFTWNLARQPTTGFISTYAWSRATKLDVVDDSTVVLHLDKTYVTYQMWDYILPQHLEAKAAAGQGPTAAMDYINHTLFNTAPTTPGLWDGPYMISAYQAGGSIELTPNPHWPGETPAIKRVVVRLVENTAALQANLLSGDVDMTPSGIGITTDQAVTLERDHGKEFQFFYRKGLSYERIDMQQTNKPLADLRVRQALLLALDRTTLIDRLFSGHATLAQSWINALEPNFTADVTSYPYDPAKARALLKEAGYTPGPDGVGRNAAGDRLSFEFATTSGNRVRELSQQVMQSWWKAIGVEVQIKNQPSRTFFGDMMRKRTYTGLTEWANSGRVGLPATPYYSSAAIPTEANNYTGQNWSGFSNAEMDHAMQAAEVELDPAKQKALWATMQRVYAANLPELPLYFRQDPDIVPAWLKNYHATGREDYQTFFAETWHP